MKISKTGVEITERFFIALECLKQAKTIRGIKTFTDENDINRWNLYTVKDNPESSILKPEWLSILVKDYGISAEWLLTGKGRMMKP